MVTKMLSILFLFLMSWSLVCGFFQPASRLGNFRTARRATNRFMSMDYYSDLGVSRGADQSEIKTAFRKLARQYHPDVNDAPDAAEKFQTASRAYEILGNEENRRKYDQFGEAAFEGGGFGGQGVQVEKINLT